MVCGPGRNVWKQEQQQSSKIHCPDPSSSLCLSLSICLSIYLSIYLSSCLSICLSVYLAVYLSSCLSVCLSICLSVCLSICLSTWLSHPVCGPQPQALWLREYKPGTASDFCQCSSRNGVIEEWKEKHTHNDAASVTSSVIMDGQHYVSLHRFKRDIATENRSVDHKLKSNSRETKKLGETGEEGS